MSMLPPQPVTLTCPNCRTTYQTPVFQLIDVGQAPELKQALLSGRINVAVCPNCGTGGMLATPMVYHDPEKQLFFVLFPQEVQATPQEQEQFIGTLTQYVMRSMPGDTPKGYMLTPRRFISLTSMLDELLEAEGIPKAALEAQRKRSQLLGQLVQAGEDEQAVRRIAEANKDGLDYEFFLTLAAYIEAAQQEQDEESLRIFTTLRDRLVELTGFDTESEGLVEASAEQAVDALVSAEEAQLPELIAEYRPAIDYEFYELLMARIEEARAARDTAKAEQLEARRDLIRETVETMDRDAQAMFEGAATAIQAVLEADDPRAALVEHRDQLGEAFLLMVGMQMQQAEQTGNTAMVERLQAIQQMASEVVQESLSPEERLIGQLLAAEKPQDATKLLRQNAAMINSDFVKQLNEMSSEMEQGGRKELADRLRQLGREAASMLF